MRNVSGYLAQVIHERLNAVEHGVDAGRQIVEFVAGIRHRYAPLQIAFDDVAAGFTDHFDLPHQPAAHDGTSRQRQGDGCGQTPCEGTHDHLFHFMKLVRTPSDEEVLSRKLDAPSAHRGIRRSR